MRRRMLACGLPNQLGARLRIRVVVVVRAIAFPFNRDRLPVMHQPIDHGGRQRVVDVEDLAPIPESAIRRDDDRTGFIAGCDDLRHQVSTSFVDGKISQLIEKEKFRSNILAEFFLQRSIQLCSGQYVDHIDRSREPHLDSLFTSNVTQRGQEMTFTSTVVVQFSDFDMRERSLP